MEAQGYYQQALTIYVEHNDRYNQASTYHQLGMVAQEQQQWAQAWEYFLKALEIDVEYQDAFNRDITLRNLARLWKASNDASPTATAANILGANLGETEQSLCEILEGNEHGSDTNS